MLAPSEQADFESAFRDLLNSYIDALNDTAKEPVLSVSDPINSKTLTREG
jgi:hypothetical protein